MKLLKSIEALNYRQLFQLAIILSILLAIPVSVALIQQETKLLYSKAEFKPPAKNVLVRQEAPLKAAEISLIRPFIGKEGDAVIIKGRNFGYYPLNAYLKLGNIDVPEGYLIAWEDEKISFYLPEGVVSGNITIYNGYALSSTDKTLTVYNTNTKTEVFFKDNKLFINNTDGIRKIVYYYGNQKIEVELPVLIIAGNEPEVLLAGLDINKLTWLTLYNNQDQVESFYIDPLEFSL